MYIAQCILQALRKSLKKIGEKKTATYQETKINSACGLGPSDPSPPFPPAPRLMVFEGDGQTPDRFKAFEAGKPGASA